MLFAVALRCSTSCRTQNAINSELVFISSNGNVAIKLALRFHFDGNWIESIGKTFSIRSNDGTFVACFPWVCVTQQCYKLCTFESVIRWHKYLNTQQQVLKDTSFLSFVLLEWVSKKAFTFLHRKIKTSASQELLRKRHLVEHISSYFGTNSLFYSRTHRACGYVFTDCYTRVRYTKHDRWLSRSYRCGSTTKAQFWKCIKNDKYMLLYSQMERSNKPQSGRKTRPNRFPYCIPKTYSVYQNKSNNNEMYAVQFDMHYELTRSA